MRIRPLGDMEYTYWLMGHSCSTNFSVIAEITGELSDETIQAVFSSLQQRYPLLNATIVPDKKYGAVFMAIHHEIPFECTTVPDVESHCSRESSPMVSIMEKEKAWHFKDNSEVLMRCHIIRHTSQSATMLFTFHHAIADAVSALIFLEDFFSTAALVDDGKQPVLTPYTDNGPLELHIVGNYKGFKAFNRMNGHTLSLNYSRCLPGTITVATDRKTWPDERHDRLIVSSLDAVQSAAVLSCARSHSCSVHSALCAAHLKAITTDYPDRKKLRTLLLSLVNLRNHPGFVSPPPSLNLMISMVDSFITIYKHAAFWELAQTIQKQTQTMLQQGQHLTYFVQMCRIAHATSWLYDGTLRSSQRFVRRGQRTRPEAVTVSNIGNVSIPERYGSVTLNNVSFLMSLSTSGIFGSGINSFNGKLNWNFTYASPSLTGEHAERLAKNCRQFLLSACGIKSLSINKI